MEQPKSASDHYQRGRMLKQMKMYDQALEAFQQAAAIDPQYAGAVHLQRALCLRSLERYEDAVAAFRQVLAVGTLSPKEIAHILYHLAQALEELGRYPEALEAYGWSRHGDPGNSDVVRRIKYLSSGGRGPLPPRQPASQSVLGDMLRRGQQFTPQVLGLLGQVWTSFGHNADQQRGQPERQSVQDGGHVSGPRESTAMRCSPPVSRDRPRENRQHARVAVRLRSHFSTKGRLVTGDGRLKDLSPGGCCVTSRVVVPVGEELECCIFPQDDGNPFTIEGATVLWTRPLQFGLAFTQIRPGVQRQISQLCRARSM